MTPIALQYNEVVLKRWRHEKELTEINPKLSPTATDYICLVDLWVTRLFDNVVLDLCGRLVLAYKGNDPEDA